VQIFKQDMCQVVKVSSANVSMNQNKSISYISSIFKSQRWLAGSSTQRSSLLSMSLSALEATNMANVEMENPLRT
jgi:hypothetical protein